jgi:hypothetical protein
MPTAIVVLALATLCDATQIVPSAMLPKVTKPSSTVAILGLVCWKILSDFATNFANITILKVLFRGAQKPTGGNLKVFWAKFSTIS